MLELSYIFLIGILLTVMLEAKALWPTTKILTHFHPLLTAAQVCLDGGNLNAVKSQEVAKIYVSKLYQEIDYQWLGCHLVILLFGGVATATN